MTNKEVLFTESDECKPDNRILKPCNLFHTPDSFQEIEKWIELHNAEEKIHLYTAAYMTLNLCAKLTNIEEIKK